MSWQPELDRTPHSLPLQPRGLRPSRPRQPPSRALSKPPPAVGRDGKRIMWTHSWIKLVLSLRRSKGGSTMNIMEGLGSHAGGEVLARWGPLWLLRA